MTERRAAGDARWPKTFPPLTAEQERIRDDFVQAWHHELPARYGIIEKFNHGYVVDNAPASFVHTLEIGAGLGEHLSYERLTPEQRRNYVALELRPAMAAEMARAHTDFQVVVGDCQQTLEQLCRFADGPLRPLADSAPARRQWTAELKALPAHFDGDNLTSDATPIHPARLIGEMRRALPRDTILFVDSGAHRAQVGRRADAAGPERLPVMAGEGPVGARIDEQDGVARQGPAHLPDQPGGVDRRGAAGQGLAVEVRR